MRIVRLLQRALVPLLCGAGLWVLPESLHADGLRFDYVERLTVEDGLAHSTVWGVHQDRRGFLWFATASALNRYDGYELKAYRHNPKDSDSLSGSEVMVILEDRQGSLWLAARGRGLNRFDPALERFERFEHDTENPQSLPDNRIQALYEDRSGALWIGAHTGLSRWHPEERTFIRFVHDPDDPGSLRPGTVRAILEDRRGILWIGTDTGLDHYDAQDGRFVHHVHNPADPESGVGALHQDRAGDLWIGTQRGPCRAVESDSAPWGDAFDCYWPEPTAAAPAFVEDFLEDQAGDLWVGTNRGLLHFIGSQRESFAHYRHDPGDPHSLSSSEIFALHEDHSGILWIATRAGVNKYDRRREQFATMGPDEIGGRQVLAIAEDPEGKVWVGTVDGGLAAHDRASGKVTRYRAEADNPKSLSDNTVMAMVVDRAGEMWVGSHGGLDRFDPESQAFIHYRHDPTDPQSFIGDRVFCLLETTSRDLWIGTFTQGLQRLDAKRQRFTSIRHDADNPQSLSSDDIYNLYEDRSGDLWVATYGGLNHLVGMNEEGSPEFVRYLHEPGNSNSLSSNKVTSIYEDESGGFWIGTSGHGLNHYDREQREFRSYWRQDGLPDDKVVGLLGDEQGNLWISTSSGLSRLDLRTETFRNFDVGDGLHGNVFYIRPTFRSPRGELFFGGEGGLTSFFPDRITDDPYPPPVLLTDFQLLNEPVPLTRSEPSSPLVRSITDTTDLILTHRQKIVGLEFSALHYASPRKNRYAYRLHGFDDGWIETDATKRFAKYTNLDAGEYIFRVKASNKDGVWNEDGASVRITVLPAWYRSWWAYSLYALALVAGLMAYVRSHREELQRERQAAEREREINQRLREVDTIKDEILANTSHELRTPLNGITGLAEALVYGSRGELPEPIKNDLSMISASGHRLASLVDDILDFSKLRDDTLELALEPVDLHTVTHAVLTLARPLVGGRQLELVNSVPKDLAATADEARLQQVLYNLVGNAVKFTENGRVEVSARTDGSWVELSVSDTGIGISPEDQQRIFESFEQADGSLSRKYGGTGLGLAISRRLIERHGGRLQVESKPDAGSRFFLTLPRSQEAPAPKTGEFISARLRTAADDSGAITAWVDEPTLTPLERDFTLLVVDDEPLIRQVLVGHLRAAGYRVIKASGGVEALHRIESESVDLVLLDVMMPGMSGYEVCRKVRRTQAREELPIILLSAKDQVEDLVSGFSKGANDYLVKPIGQHELLARVSTHLSLLLVHRQQAQEVRLLEGLLPICCRCKKICDDQGNWTDIEIYVRDRSQAEFSHGICPACGEAALKALERGI